MTRRSDPFPWGAFVILLLLMAGTGAGYVASFGGPTGISRRHHLAAALGTAILGAGGFALTVMLSRRREKPARLRRLQLVSFVTSGIVGGTVFGLVAEPGWPVLGLAALGALAGFVAAKLGIA
jgi:hypothetical protein